MRHRRESTKCGGRRANQASSATFFFKVSHYFLLFLGQFRCPSAGLTASHPFAWLGMYIRVFSAACAVRLVVKLIGILLIRKPQGGCTWALIFFFFSSLDNPWLTKSQKKKKKKRKSEFRTERNVSENGCLSFFFAEDKGPLSEGTWLAR